MGRVKYTELMIYVYEVTSINHVLQIISSLTSFHLPVHQLFRKVCKCPTTFADLVISLLFLHIFTFWTLFLSSWMLTPLCLLNRDIFTAQWSSSSMVSALMSILSDINIATPTSFWLASVWNTIFQSTASYNLQLAYVSYKLSSLRFCWFYPIWPHLSINWMI